ncbi:MAG: hypothetical protein ABIL45_03665 [candidate division WOR-3 bacterium]
MQNNKKNIFINENQKFKILIFNNNSVFQKQRKIIFERIKDLFSDRKNFKFQNLEFRNQPEKFATIFNKEFILENSEIINKKLESLNFQELRERFEILQKELEKAEYIKNYKPLIKLPYSIKEFGKRLEINLGVKGNPIPIILAGAGIGALTGGIIETLKQGFQQGFRNINWSDVLKESLIGGGLGAIGGIAGRVVGRGAIQIGSRILTSPTGRNVIQTLSRIGSGFQNAYRFFNDNVFPNMIRLGSFLTNLANLTFNIFSQFSQTIQQAIEKISSFFETRIRLATRNFIEIYTSNFIRLGARLGYSIEQTANIIDKLLSNFSGAFNKVFIQNLAQLELSLQRMGKSVNQILGGFTQFFEAEFTRTGRDITNQMNVVLATLLRDVRNVRIIPPETISRTERELEQLQRKIRNIQFQEARITQNQEQLESLKRMKDNILRQEQRLSEQLNQMKQNNAEIQRQLKVSEIIGNYIGDLLRKFDFAFQPQFGILLIKSVQDNLKVSSQMAVSIINAIQNLGKSDVFRGMLTTLGLMSGLNLSQIELLRETGIITKEGFSLFRNTIEASMKLIDPNKTLDRLINEIVSSINSQGEKFDRNILSTENIFRMLEKLDQTTASNLNVLAKSFGMDIATLIRVLVASRVENEKAQKEIANQISETQQKPEQILNQINKSISSLVENSKGLGTLRVIANTQNVMLEKSIEIATTLQTYLPRFVELQFIITSTMLNIATKMGVSEIMTSAVDKLAQYIQKSNEYLDKIYAENRKHTDIQEQNVRNTKDLSSKLEKVNNQTLIPKPTS